MESTTEVGNKGELAARDFFIEEGYKILEQNWTYNKWEIDLIVQLDKTVCFVEVKTRKEQFSIDPVLTVSALQQNRIIDCANKYIEQFSIDEEIRFDIIGVIYKNGSYKIDRHIKEAFYPTIDQA